MRDIITIFPLVSIIIAASVFGKALNGDVSLYDDFFLKQVILYRQALFTVPNSTNQWINYYEKCFVKLLDESWQSWIPNIELDLPKQRLETQSWLANRQCFDVAGNKSPFKHAESSGMSLFDVIYGLRHGDMGYFDRHVLHANSSAPSGVRVEHPYADVLVNSCLYSQLMPNPQQCQYDVQVVAAEGLEKDAYDLVVTVTQHSCPQHNPLFFSHDDSQASTSGKTEARALPNAHLQVVVQEGNLHIVCDTDGAAVGSKKYVYTHKCNVVVDYLFFNHLVKPLQNSTRNSTGIGVGEPVKEAFTRSALHQRLTLAHQFTIYNLPQVYNHETNMACLTVMVFLHYEGFDMFSDVFPVSLGKALHRQKHCLEIMTNDGEASHEIIATVPAKAKQLTKSAWLNRIQKAFSHLEDYEYMQKALVDSGYKRIYIVGASHARYLWDVLVNNYVANGASELMHLTPKHESAMAGNLTYDMLRFSQLSRQYLLHQCSMIEAVLGLLSVEKINPDRLLKSPHRFKIFIQFGAWDLTYTNILYPFLSEKHGMQVLVDTLRAIATKRCSYFLDITVMSTVPAPMPVDTKMHRHLIEQAELGRYPPYLRSTMIRKNEHVSTCRAYRTNAAIQAYSAYMKHGISQIEYPSKDIKQLFDTKLQGSQTSSVNISPGRLDYLDLVHIMMAFNEDTVDNMHFLKVNHQGRRMDRVPKLAEVSTLAGELFLGAVVDVLTRTKH